LLLAAGKLDSSQTVFGWLDDDAEQSQRLLDALFERFELGEDFVLSGFEVGDCLVGRRERKRHENAISLAGTGEGLLEPSGEAADALD
jgi:hypothetical protein